MKIFITTLFTFSLGFFEAGIQLYLQFDKISVSVFIVLEILCGIFFLIGSLFLNDTIKIEKRDKQLKVLRPHFDEIKEEVPEVIPNLSERNGQICLSHGSLGGLLREFSPEFIVHFPQENNTWNTYRSNIKTHNKNHSEFAKKIRDSLESSGIKVIGSRPQPQSKSIGIYETAIEQLFFWWLRHSECLECSIKFDFTFSLNIPDLHISGFGDSAIIAYAENESDSDKCKKIFNDVASNVSLKKDAISLINSANDLLNSIFDLKSKLADKIQKIDTYWPHPGTYWSTEEYEFKRLDECPKCRYLPK